MVNLCYVRVSKTHNLAKYNSIIWLTSLLSFHSQILLGCVWRLCTEELLYQHQHCSFYGFDEDLPDKQWKHYAGVAQGYVSAITEEDHVRLGYVSAITEKDKLRLAQLDYALRRNGLLWHDLMVSLTRTTKTSDLIERATIAKTCCADIQYATKTYGRH